MSQDKFKHKKRFPSDWLQTITILAALIGTVVWLDYKHERSISWLDSKHEKANEKIEASIEKMDERWKWLFDWAHKEIHDVKSERK